jgi:hypothetical protein
VPSDTIDERHREISRHPGNIAHPIAITAASQSGRRVLEARLQRRLSAQLLQVQRVRVLLRHIDGHIDAHGESAESSQHDQGWRTPTRGHRRIRVWDEVVRV